MEFRREDEAQLLVIARDACGRAARKHCRTVSGDALEDLAMAALHQAFDKFDADRGNIWARITYFAELAVRRYQATDLLFDDQEVAAGSSGEPSRPTPSDHLWPGFALSVLTPDERKSLLHEWGLVDRPDASSLFRARRRRLDPAIALSLIEHGSAREREWAAFALALFSAMDEPPLSVAKMSAAAERGLRATYNGGLDYPGIIQLGCVWTLKRLNPSKWSDEWALMLEPAVLPYAIYGDADEQASQLRSVEMSERAIAAVLDNVAVARIGSRAVWNTFDTIRLAADRIGLDALHVFRQTGFVSRDQERSAIALVLSRINEPTEALRALERTSTACTAEALKRRLRGRPTLSKRVYSDVIRRLPRDEAALLLPDISDSPHVFIRHSSTKLRLELGTDVTGLVRDLRRVDPRSSYLARGYFHTLAALSSEKALEVAETCFHTARWSRDTWLRHDVLGALYELAQRSTDPDFSHRADRLIRAVLTAERRGFCPFLTFSLARAGYFT